MSNDHDHPATETVDELRKSFFYGSRSNLNFKFVRDLSDGEFGDFIAELFDATASIVDGSDPDLLIDAAFRWQVQAYAGHLGDPADFPHKKDDVPIAPMNKPLAEARIMLLTSSGHFVEGDDPEPFGVVDMSQAEAESRIGDSLKEKATLSTIPVDTPFEKLRVRHGGYPVQAAVADHQVVLPLQHLHNLATSGAIGGLVENAYSFVGATAQGHIKHTHGPEWAQLAKDSGADAVLLVPV